MKKATGAARLIGVLGILVLLFGGAGGQYQGKLSSVEKNDNAQYLPSSAQSTEVNSEAEAFQSVQTIPGFVVYQRDSGLTADDRTFIQGAVGRVRAVGGVAASQVTGPNVSADGTTAEIQVPLIGKTGNHDVDGTTLVNVEKAVLADARSGAPAGLVVHSAGPGGQLVAFIDAFNGIDGTLLLAAGLVVIVILLAVYRSPILWIVPLVSALLALGAAALIIYYLAKSGTLTLTGQSQGILSVLVLGAGTDYALLLVSRYREELHHFPSRLDAMQRAWRRSATAIAASASTVVLGLLCLTFGELNSDRSLGPVCAIGVAMTAVVMLTFLPLLLTVVPRAVFWPRIPRPDDAGDPATTGPWSRIAGVVTARDRRSWILTTLVLVILALGTTTLRAGGLSTLDSFTNTPDAVTGQRIFDAHFPQGTGAPAQITAASSTIPQVIQAVESVPGVSTAPGSVCVEPDYAKLASLRSAGTSTAASRSGCAPPQLQVPPHNGRLIVDATLTAAYDSPAAYSTVERLRTAVSGIAGAHAIVGGASAINLDTNNASAHDRDLIIPIVLVVILVVLMLLLRAVLAPILLILTVVLSFTATLGVSAFAFNHVLGFSNADPSFPLFAFVFLVALGVDYNIFLMTRVREEALARGTHEGVRRGLAVTGGVITSAGLVLAATFAVLGVIPLVFLAEIGFAVAFGVLLDTLIVRSILVPALVHDVGRRVWWPSRIG